MSKEISRIAVYWYPPRQLADVLERAWRGDLARKYEELARRSQDDEERKRYKQLHKICDLLARHCGDCPIWLAHATVLDAICILAEDRDRFVQAMRDIAHQFLPIRLAKPAIKEWGWGNNVFLRWEDGHGPGIQRLRQFRVAVAEEASRFMVIERVSWEAISEMDHLLATLGPLARREFRRALADLKRLCQDGNAPRLPYAPNVGLGWYIDRLLSGRDLKDAELPFPPSPHVSVATTVRADDRYGMSAKEVGDFIKEHLPRMPELAGLLGEQVVHAVDRVHIVEPAPPFVPPLEMTVIDRPTGRVRTEFRQPWQPKEELVRGEKMQRNVTMVWGWGSKDKRPRLMEIVTSISDGIREKLTNDQRFAGVVFEPYAEGHIHATIIGMEVVKVLGRPVNLSFLRNNGVQRLVHPRLLLDLLASTAAPLGDNQFLAVRFGGWSRACCQCKDAADLLAWACRTGKSPLHTYSRSAYQGSFYIGQQGQVMLTGWAINGADTAENPQFTRALYNFRATAEHAGYLDKFHRADKPEWRDDDFYIRLGTLKGCSDALRCDLEEHIRGLLAARKPVFVQVRVADMSVVYYEDPSLAKVIEAVPVPDAINDPRRVDALYERWLSDNP